jgi:LPPG:FO 2-phospho-L-lactate transferase
MSANSSSHVIALSGGVGGAKLALGLSRCVDACDLTVVANTADDFEHLGLYISPDVDTVLYTLAGISNQEQGWGLADESWQCMGALERLGGETWFRLGDRDLALHVQRTQLLKQPGATLTGVTEYLSRALSVAVTILPMCDQSVATIVRTPQGDMPFQHYFVREHCNPVVAGFRFAGIEQAQINPRLVERCAQSAARCIVLCPSNPYVSLAPMLDIKGMREFLRGQSAPVIAVSPIVGGGALKGPAAKMMQELKVEPSVLSVARMYRGFVDGLVIDAVDASAVDAIADMGITPLVTQTVMRTLDDRERLARDVLDFAQRLAA